MTTLFFCFYYLLGPFFLLLFWFIVLLMIIVEGVWRRWTTTALGSTLALAIETNSTSWSSFSQSQLVRTWLMDVMLWFLPLSWITVRENDDNSSAIFSLSQTPPHQGLTQIMFILGKYFFMYWNVYVGSRHVDQRYQAAIKNEGLVPYLCTSSSSVIPFSHLLRLSLLF